MDFDIGANVLQPGTTVWSTSNFDGSTTDTLPHHTTSTSLSPSSASPASITQPQSQEALNTWQFRFNQEWAMLSAEQQSLSNHSTPQKPPAVANNKREESAGMPAFAAIRGLSDLNVELFTLSSAVPKPPNSLSQPLSWKNKDVAIDRTFRLSLTFIEILNDMYPNHSLEIPPTTPDTPNISFEVSNPPTWISAQNSPVDHASLLLVLSCYQRLVETYGDIFGNMQACLDRSSITAREDYVQMPDVKIGNFTLPDSSALQITLILQLARDLLRRMGVIIKNLNRKHTAPGDGKDDLMSHTFKAVNDRENELIGGINTLRNTLIMLNIL
jgi:hypothetical protein